MTLIEKLVSAVPTMRPELTHWCGLLTVLHAVASEECRDSPALEAFKAHLVEQHEQVKEMCSAYDQMRALAGRLETERGVESPRFYVDENAGCVNKSHCPVLGEN